MLHDGSVPEVAKSRTLYSNPLVLVGEADVAVFLNHVPDPIREQMAMCDDAYDIWMKAGICIFSGTRQV